MGQGTFTGLAPLVAEEMDADWSQIRAEPAPADARLYNNLDWGPVQGTGGSSSIANPHDQPPDRPSVVMGQSVSVRAALGGHRLITNKQQTEHARTTQDS